MSFFVFLFFRRCFDIGTGTKEVRINEDITAAEVRVVGDDGSQLGVMKIGNAIRAAYEKNLDLVEIAPQAAPPVCRIMDYGKFRFEKEKKEKEARKKQQKVDVKEIQLSCRIDTHDFQTKLNHAKRFISEGSKIKVAVKFKGREMSHTAIGMDIITTFGKELEEIANIDKPPVLDGRQMLMFLSPKSAQSKKKAAKDEKNVQSSKRESEEN